MINGILDFSKIESGGPGAGGAPVPPARRWWRRPRAAWAWPRTPRGSSCRTAWRRTCPTHVVGDDGRLRQVLLNLMSNAVKFTDRGQVVLEIEKEWEQAGEVALHGVVRDTGIGIPPERREAIFEPFTQADGSTHAAVRRHRPGPHHLVAARGADGRRDLGGERGRAAAAPSISASAWRSRDRPAVPVGRPETSGACRGCASSSPTTSRSTSGSWRRCCGPGDASPRSSGAARPPSPRWPRRAPPERPPPSRSSTRACPAWTASRWRRRSARTGIDGRPPS